MSVERTADGPGAHEGTRLLGPGRRESSRVVVESVVLPGLFLTVSLLGGFRAGRGVGARWLPPPLMALVLTLMVLAVLQRGRLLVPERLMSARRSGLENLCGLAVLLTLAAATAQLFNTLTPESGLLNVAFNVGFLVLLLTTMAARPRGGFLFRSVLVLLVSAFTLKYVVIAALYDPGAGLMKRVLVALLEGTTLSPASFEYDPTATGYTALLAVVLYAIGMALLEGSGLRAHGSRRLMARGSRVRRGGSRAAAPSSEFPVPNSQPNHRT